MYDNFAPIFPIQFSTTISELKINLKNSISNLLWSCFQVNKNETKDSNNKNVKINSNPPIVILTFSSLKKFVILDIGELFFFFVFFFVIILKKNPRKNEDCNLCVIKKINHLSYF